MVVCCEVDPDRTELSLPVKVSFAASSLLPVLPFPSIFFMQSAVDVSESNSGRDCLSLATKTQVLMMVVRGHPKGVGLAGQLASFLSSSSPVMYDMTLSRVSSSDRSIKINGTTWVEIISGKFE